MATYTVWLSSSFVADDARYREYIGYVRNGILSSSFYLVTSSFNIATVTKPVATTTENGYDIYQFDDSLHTISPLYLRVGYGTPNTATALALTLRIGTSYNSGTLALAGVQGTATGLPNTAVTHLGPVSINVMGSPSQGFLGISIFPELANAINQFIVERGVDTAGNPTGSYATIIASRGAGSVEFQQTITPSGSVPGTTQPVTVITPFKSPPIYDGRWLPGFVFPVFGQFLNPTPNMVVVATTDGFSIRGMAKFKMYGVERTYMCLNTNWISIGATSNNNRIAMMRWE
jgi:hypothetical protein